MNAEKNNKSTTVIKLETFYPDQEKYYRQLENWAEKEIKDEKCSNWIKFYLWKGRTLPIRQVGVLRFKGNFEKGKSFLLSKYEEKLKWDEKKKLEREFNHNSLFDSFDEDYNSFQEICKNLENKKSLYPQCICANMQKNCFPKFSMFEDWEDGIKLSQDSITYNLFEIDMTLSSMNRYFYLYTSKYKHSIRKIIIYSDEAFGLIKEYLMAVLPEIIFQENIVSCMTILESSKKTKQVGITTLLSYLKEDYNPNPKVVVNYTQDKNCISENSFQNKVGYRVFTNAAIFHISQKINYKIDLPLNKSFTCQEFDSLIEVIEKNYNELSFEDKYLCHFINSKKFKFPNSNSENFDMYRLSRKINLFHNVYHHYDTPIFTEWLFPFGKIVSQYGNYDLKKNTESIGGDFYKYKDDKNNWFNKNNKFFLLNLRILCYLNWVFVCNETGNIKKLTSLFLYNLNFSSYLDAYKRDKAFFLSLLYYILIQNEKIFLIIIDSILASSNEQLVPNEYKSFDIFYNLIRYFSNNFKGWGKELSFKQLYYLNHGRKRHDLINELKKSRKCEKYIGDEEILNFANRINNFIENLINKDKYPHSDILDIFKNMIPFNIPDNFRYVSKHNYTYMEYNGDYSGTYAHDVMGYSNDDIDTIFDGDPSAYWNID